MMLVDVPKQNVDDLIKKLSSMSDMNASVYEANEERKPTPTIGCAYCRKICIRSYSSPLAGERKTLTFVAVLSALLF